MDYFSFISHQYSCTNALQKELLEYLLIRNRLFIPEAEFKAFQEEVLERIATINASHPRCTPIQASWWKGACMKDYHLSGLPGICNFYLYESRKTLSKRIPQTTIITGPAASGKTTLAKQLAEGRSAVWVDNIWDWAFTDVNELTELIVCDGLDLKNPDVVERAKHLVSGDYLFINRKHQTSFTIRRPDLIIITQDEDISFGRRPGLTITRLQAPKPE